MSERNRYRGDALETTQAMSLTSYPGRIVVLAMITVSPWLLGSLAGWAQFGLAIGGIIALGLWFLEIALIRPKSLVLPLSVLPLLLSVLLGVTQLWPLSSDIKERLAASHSLQQWEELAAPGEMDREILTQMELHLGPQPEVFRWPATLPISIDPHATRLLTTQLLFAAIAYVLGAYYFHQARSMFWLCLVLTINGLVLATFGIVQKLAGADNALFMGALPVEGAVFGPFVNRNNAAGWLIMSMSAAVMLVVAAFLGQSERGGEDEDDWMLHQQRRQTDWWYGLLRMVHELNASKLAAVFALVFIIGGVVATLSRGGVVGMILGSIIGFLVIGVSSSNRGRQGVQYLAVAIGLGLLLVGWLGFGQKLMDRFEQADKSNLFEDARVQNWTDTAPLFAEQWFMGSGWNTYQHVHRPLRTTPELGIFTFAENVYFQTFIEGGAIGGLLLVCLFGWSLYHVSFLIRRARHPAMLAAGVLGSVAIGSQAVTAFFDFGLYIPSNTLTFAVLMGAIAGQTQHYARRHRDPSGLAAWGWGRFAPVVVLVLLGAGIVGALQYYRLGQTEDALLLAKTVREKEHLATNAEIDDALQRLTTLAKLGFEPNLHDALGQQWLQKYRRRELERIQANLPGDLTEKQVLELWSSTSPAWRAAAIRQMQEVNPASAAALQKEFLGGELQRQALLNSYGSLLLSRRSCPFRPELHLRLAEVGRLLSSASPVPHLDRPVAIAPQNARYQWMVGLQKLEACRFAEQSEFFEPALEHLRKAMALDPTGLRALEPMLLKKSVLGVPVDGLSAATYARRLLARYPDLLLDFLDRNLEIRNQPEVRKELLLATKAELDDRRLDFSYSVPETWAMGRIEMELGNWQAAREQFDLLLQLNYAHTNGRYQRVLARIELGELEKAEEEIRVLLEAHPNSSAYKATLQRIQNARVENR
ncbi:MAG: O-antigen ligase family protein [Planctomycetaceae bacterium]|nr:O-antigen ligase family protein [Planctomycetaceae bacterium]